MIFSGLLNQIRNPWPIHTTIDLTDYSQADQYQSKGKYVWLKHPTVSIREDFPLSWAPDDDQDRNVHVFPYCKQRSKTVIRHDALKLVPTDPRIRRYDIQQKLIAGYDRNPYVIVFVSKNDSRAVEKFENHRAYFPNAYLIQNDGTPQEFIRKVLTKMYSRFVWLIDIDVKLDDTFELFHNTQGATNTVFAWPVRSTAYSDAYTAGQVSLCPYSYFKQTANSSPHAFEVVDRVAGTVNNASNPQLAYVSAYLDTVFALTRGVEGSNSDDLIAARIDTLAHNLASYVKRGITDAQADYNDESVNTDQLMQTDWILQKFKAGQQSS